MKASTSALTKNLNEIVNPMAEVLWSIGTVIDMQGDSSREKNLVREPFTSISLITSAIGMGENAISQEYGKVIS